MGSNPVTTSCMCQCTNGTAPTPLIAAQAQTVHGALPAATISDLPKVPFGMCNNPANPAVASATAAAAGVLTPAPCIPVFAGTWLPGAATVLIGGKPALTKACQLMCAYGGMITIKNVTAQNVQEP